MDKQKKVRGTGEADENQKKWRGLAEKISRPVPWKIWWAADVILAGLASGYQIKVGAGAEQAALVFVGVFLGGSPLPQYISSQILMWRARQMTSKAGAYCRTLKDIRKIMCLDALLMNKNGVVTQGKPYVADMVAEGVSKNSLLALAASAEYDSAHPIAKAIVTAANQQGVRLQRLAAFSEIPHAGVEAIINKATVRVGTLAWLKREKVKISATLATKSDQMAARGKIPVFVSDGKYAKGIIALSDDIITDTISVVHRLQRQGIKAFMVTNDSHKTAVAVQKVTALDGATGSLNAVGKIRELQLLRAKHSGVGMLGDSAKEPEVFAAADLSIHLLPTAPAEHRVSKRRVETAEMEAQAQAALVEADSLPDPRTINADVVLTGGMLALLPAIKLARKAKNIERQNLLAAYVVALALVMLSVGVFGSFGSFWLDPLQTLTALAVAASALTMLALLRLST